MQNETEDYQASIVDSRVKKQQVLLRDFLFTVFTFNRVYFLKYEKRKADLENRLADLEVTVKEVEGRRTNVDARIEALKNDVARLRHNHEKIEVDLKAKIEEREPVKAAKKKEFDEKSQKLHNMKAHTSEMNNKMKEMAESKIIMEKTIEKANEEIDALT